MPRITPNLWFDTDGEEAAKFYVSVFPNSAITNVSRYGEGGPRPAGTVLTSDPHDLEALATHAEYVDVIGV